jgi:hypothetical protein
MCKKTTIKVGDFFYGYEKKECLEMKKIIYQLYLHI